MAFGLLEDNTHAWWFHDVIRIVFSLLEWVVALLIPFVYQILVKIANNTIISGDMVRVIFGRVQLILGVIMIFKLSMAVIQYIINPDMMDDKSKGLGGIITRILIMLVLLTSIVPLNIPKSSIVEGSYNDYLRDDGLLFGTLYFAQSRILNTNIIGTIILGDENSKNGSFDDPEFAGNQLALLIMKTVIRPNDYDGKTIGKCDDPDKCICPRSEIDSEDYGSEEEDKKQYDRYFNDPTLPAEQLVHDMHNIKCFDDGFAFVNWDGEAKYAYTYTPIVGGILGGFVLLTLISFCVDVAIRAIKLAILRLIAPIPIMSYIDPKSGQNGAFQNWVKTLTKTYLDLFVRLAIIFFVILIVRSIADDITAGNFKTFDFSTPVGAFATIFIILGLFFFAKQAPQFIYEAMGMKYEKGAGIFSGLGKIVATGASIGGSIGAARTNYRASQEELPNTAGGFRRTFQPLGSGLIGGITGLGKGLGAATSAKDHYTRAALDAQAKRNALRASHSTAIGRLEDDIYGAITGSTLAAKDNAALEANKEASSKLKSYKSLLQDEAKTHGAYGNGKFRDAAGHEHERKFNYERLLAAMNAKDEHGNFEYDGEKLNVSFFDNNVLNSILDDQAVNYQKGIHAAGAKAYADNGKIENARVELVYQLGEAGLGSSITNDDVLYDDLGAAIGKASSTIASMNTDMKHIKHIANYKANKNK